MGKRSLSLTTVSRTHSSRHAAPVLEAEAGLARHLERLALALKDGRSGLEPPAESRLGGTECLDEASGNELEVRRLRPVAISGVCRGRPRHRLAMPVGSCCRNDGIRRLAAVSIAPTSRPVAQHDERVCGIRHCGLWKTHLLGWRLVGVRHARERIEAVRSPSLALAAPR